uniref:HD-GYP domain-containing protein n=2 Tax=Cajanus cajan TaxID=3821 RepID=A0A151R2M2_CAJCA|nr:hypothetical protein KK1_042171 [Cajanus cajan]
MPESEPPFPYPSSEFGSNDYTSSWSDEGSGSEPSTGGGGGGGAGGSYTSFSSAFKDILKGTVRGHSLTMPEHGDPKSKHQQHAVRQICSHTDYPDVCLSTVVPFLGHHLDVMNILEAAIKACSFQTNFTLSKVIKHMSRSSEMATALASCKEQYHDALENLQRAMDAIPLRDLGTVTVMLSAVMADVSACESGFEDLKSHSPMGNSEGLVTITASNCLSIAAIIPY